MLAQAQIVFDKTGKVSSCPTVLSTDCCPAEAAPVTNTKDLDAWSAAQQKLLAQELTKSIGITFDSLQRSTSPLRHYYSWLWSNTDVDQLAKDLEIIKSALGKVPYKASLLPTSPLYILDTLVESRLQAKHRFYTLKDSTTASQYALTLRKVAATNDLLLAYYKHIYQLPANSVYKTLNIIRYSRLQATAQRRQLAINALLIKARVSGITLPLLNSMNKEHKVFTNYHQSDTLFKLLRAPWAKAWLWRSGGVLTLNPLPFTNDELLLIRPSYDTLKAAYYARYVNNTLQAKLAATTRHNIPAFTEEMKLLGKEKSLFIDSVGYKKAVAANRATAAKFQTTEFSINAFSIPKSQADFNYLQLMSMHKEEILPTTKLDAIAIDNRVMVSVHNIEKGHTLRMVRKKAVLIKDESAAQRAINDGLESMSALNMGETAATIVKQIGAINKNNKPSRDALKRISIEPSYPVRTAALGESESFVLNRETISFNYATTEQDFWKEAENIVKSTMNTNLSGLNPDYKFAEMLSPDNIVFNNNIFLKVKKINTAKVRSYLRKPTQAHFTQLIRLIVSDYFTDYVIEVLAPAAIQVLRTDSLHLRTSRTILAQSTIPPHKVTREVDKVPLFRSARAITMLSDSTLHVVYHLQDVTEKDITTFSALDYRTGKLYRIQFSAGLAYTFNPVREPELSTANNQVTYTSTDSRYRFYAGLHFYPFRKGLLLQDKHFAGSRETALSRLNVLVALGIPKPIDNIYIGLGYDFGPGIRTTFGMQLHGYRQYEVFNNALVRDAKVYKVVFPFVSLGIDPVSFVKALTLFK